MMLNLDYFNIRKTAIQFLIVLLSGFLLSCASENNTDLLEFISEVKERPKTQIESLPAIKIVEPFIFRPDGLRDPFKPAQVNDQLDAINVASGNGIRPDMTRRKEELESYSLDSLRMVGTIQKDGFWGLIKASDGTIHRVREGNYMGKNYGKIIRIGDDKIELMEIVPDQPGTWREQQASLALAE